MTVLPRVREDLFYQEVSEGGVLFDADGEKVYVLNASAAFVWNCCDGAHSIEAIVEELATALGSKAPDRKVLAADVEKSLDEFKRGGLLAQEKP